MAEAYLIMTAYSTEVESRMVRVSVEERTRPQVSVSGLLQPSRLLIAYERLPPIISTLTREQNNRVAVVRHGAVLVEWDLAPQWTWMVCSAGLELR